MSNLNGRRVRSLDDIPRVFKKPVRRQHDAKPNLSKASLGYLPCEFILNEKNIEPSKSVGNDDDGAEDFLKISDIPKLEIDRVTEKNLTINPVDTPNFVDPLLEGKYEDDHREDENDWEQKFKNNKRLLSWIDALFALSFITPMIVGFWRGIWNLMDLHVQWFPHVLTFILGILIHMIFAIFRNCMHARVNRPSRKKNCINKTFFKSLQILYTYIFGVACNAQWRGGWFIFDYYLGSHVWAITGVLVILVTSLAILRSVRNVMAAPTIVLIDKFGFVFRFPTRYESNTRDWSLYLLDCAFSVGVVGTLVVFVWRGVWILVDLFLFPDDREYSAIGSLAIGYVIVTVTFCLQPLMRYVCARLQGLARLIVADGFLLLSFLGTVNVWRGIWNLLDLWLVPNNLELSCWITHVGCFVFLVLLNCSNSILVRGVYIDAEGEDGKCVAFPCHYLRLFFKVEREKKEARRRNLLVASKDFRPRPDGNAKDTENGALLPNSAPTTILPANPESLV
ncbi:uncharacterized protein LOC143362521 isoform X1 [Halictus rubicundus]|uniref:uncharacterized protein LOC143362521 isoform X1 n=1 Tax=Halictus rubicundus TaxID=77578 RepID=UPI004035C34F